MVDFEITIQLSATGKNKKKECHLAQGTPFLKDCLN
jgi:hypothetical protein